MEVSEELHYLGANTEINFAKYRAGSLETKGLWWQGDKTKFMDPEEKDNDYASAHSYTAIETNNEEPF